MPTRTAKLAWSNCPDRLGRAYRPVSRVRGSSALASRRSWADRLWTATLTDSGFIAGAAACSFGRMNWLGTIASVPSPALPDHGPGLRLAGAATSQPGVQQRGNHDPASAGAGGPRLAIRRSPPPGRAVPAAVVRPRPPTRRPPRSLGNPQPRSDLSRLYGCQ